MSGLLRSLRRGFLRHRHLRKVGLSNRHLDTAPPMGLGGHAASDSSGAAVFTAPFRVGSEPAQGLIFDFTDSKVSVVEGPRVNGSPVWVSVSTRYSA